MHEIDVIIKGRPGAGKTTLTKILVNALRDAGFTNDEVAVVELEEVNDLNPEKLKERVKGLKTHGIKVSIFPAALPAKS